MCDLGAQFFKIIHLFIYVSLGLCGFAELSLVAAGGHYSFWGAQASHCEGFSLQSTVSRSMGSVVGPRHVKSSRTRDQTCVQVDSYPLHHQGSPWGSFFNRVFSRVRDFKACLICVCGRAGYMGGMQAAYHSLSSLIMLPSNYPRSGQWKPLQVGSCVPG